MDTRAVLCNLLTNYYLTTHTPCPTPSVIGIYPQLQDGLCQSRRRNRETPQKRKPFFVRKTNIKVTSSKMITSKIMMLDLRHPPNLNQKVKRRKLKKQKRLQPSKTSKTIRRIIGFLVSVGPDSASRTMPAGIPSYTIHPYVTNSQTSSIHGGGTNFVS